MAYRRKQPAARVFTLEDSRPAAFSGLEASVASPSLAARAMQASAAHRDSSFSVYGDSTAFSPRRESNRLRSLPPPPQQNSSSYEYTSMKNLNESKYGFWGTLARKARTFVDNDDVSNQSQGLDRNLRHTFDRSASDQPQEIYQKIETTRRRADAIGSSLNHIGGTIKNALEEGLTIVENKTADIIHETKKLNIRRKGNPASVPSQPAEKSSGQHIPPIQTDYETQLKASRDVANAMAAKAKLLLRELKTVKADLAFAKERCTQLEEENKVWREGQEKGDSPEDDDLIRLQLETLLAEKARLAHENSMYSRENRFLREIVEYHQLTMQDVVYVDEGIEEVTEVYMTPNPPAAPSPTASPANVGVLPIHPNPTHAVPSVILPQDCPIDPTPPRSSPLCDPPNTIPLSPVVAGSLA